MRNVLVLALVTVGLLASSSVRAADVVSRLEQRTAERAVRGGARDRSSVVVAQGRKLSVWVRPGSNVIGVTRTGFMRFGEKGYFLGANGQLSAPDRAELGELIARHAPKTTAASIDAALAQADRDDVVRDRVLTGQDPRIASILTRIAAHRGPGELVLHTDGKSTLSYRPQTGVLVESRRFSERGFFLTRDRTAVAPESLTALRTVLATR